MSDKTFKILGLCFQVFMCLVIIFGVVFSYARTTELMRDNAQEMEHHKTIHTTFERQYQKDMNELKEMIRALRWKSNGTR